MGFPGHIAMLFGMTVLSYDAYGDWLCGYSCWRAWRGGYNTARPMLKYWGWGLARILTVLTILMHP